MSTARKGKLDWIAAVARARDLRPAEKVTAIALAAYANSTDLGNAHPGRRRLAADVHVSVRTIERHLEMLAHSGWIERTAYGSTASKRNFADVYRLLTANLTSRHLDVDWSWPQAGDDQSTNGDDQSTNDDDQSTPRCRPTRFSTPGPLHPSDTPVSASDSQATPTRDEKTHQGTDWDALASDYDRLEEALEKKLGCLDAEEYNLILAMWESDRHPKAIYNKLMADRNGSKAYDPWAM